MKFIKNNKNLSILILIAIVLLIILLIFLFPLIHGISKNGVYGNRLDGIEKVVITDKTIESIKKSFNNVEGVEKVEYNLQGRIVKFTVNAKDMEIEKAKELVSLIKLSQKQMDFYDVQLLAISDDPQYPLFGYRNKNNKEFTFTYNKVGETSE